MQLVPNERMDAVLAAAFGPFGADMVKIAAGYSEAERRVIADWISATTEALVANTHRIMTLDQPELHTRPVSSHT